MLEAVGRVPVGEVVTLHSDKLPFKLQVYVRHKDKSNLILYTDIIGDSGALRLERIQRALDDKCKKLESWVKKDGRPSVLALKSNDIQLSNAFVISDAVQAALKKRNDQPGPVVLVETDIAPNVTRRPQSLEEHRGVRRTCERSEMRLS